MEEKDGIISVWNEVVIRPITATDSLDELTELLHKAYKVLADMGLKFFATYQTTEQTRERIEDAYCLVGIKDGKIVATISYYGPERDSGLEWYQQETVAHFGQFAVEPALQKSGLGGHLIELIEEHARQNGVLELALDTSEKAFHLLDYYQKKGFRFIGYHQWSVTNYRSVVLSKKLI